MHSPEDVFETFRLLGYNVQAPDPYEGEDLESFEFDPVDRDAVNRAYIVAQHATHTVYLYEVNDWAQVRLRGLAWNALQRGTALLVVTRDYREILFVDPRTVGKVNKSSVRVNKLKLITGDPTRHDLDTLNAIHAYRRSGPQIYDAQAEAFNVTTITKKFYDEYHDHYERVRAVIRQYNPGVREFQDSDQTDKLHAFTQRLLGRLMFLYFLQRKGWLGGKQKFLTDMYMLTLRQHAHEVNGQQETFHYYREVLEPLFFETMNTQRPGNITRWEGIRIPYLNGGLFDESRDPAGPIVLPDSLFDPNSHEGVLAFFNRYNFTIANDTPLEQDVAVDPEMLGKVFENMLEERDRGQSGSFYTPRTIVAYMCQEALAGYLEESAGVPRETTRTQFDPDAELRYAPDEAERVNAALNTLTVLDPAVGSGSFLIGMLNEIIWLRRICYQVLTGEQEVPGPTLADWKEAIIRDTLYGVDIKPEAIEIAQLRLWLALVVDQTLEQARPLPNLDYKLMAGNSLIETIDGEPVLGELAASILQPKPGMDWKHVNDQLKLFDPNPVQGRMLLFDEEKQVEKERVALDELRRSYFRATPEQRRALRDEIAKQERRIVSASLKEKADKLQAQVDHYGKLAAQAGGKLKAREASKLKIAVEKLGRITQLQQDMAKPDYVPSFFLYRLHFSEVFEHKGGFDIVVANPPYVRGELLGAQKPELKAAYPDVYAGTADLYIYFFARAHNLLRAYGQLSFITSNKYLRANYGRGLRTFLAENLRLNAILDFGDLPVFDAAAYPCIVLGVKDTQPADGVPAAAIRSMEALDDLHGSLINGVNLVQADLGEREWQIADADVQQVLAKLKAAGMPLGEYVGGKIYRGILTGFNEAFVIDAAKRAELIAADPRSAEIIKPWLRGRDVKRWQTQWAGLYIIAIQNSDDKNTIHAWRKARNEKEATAIFERVYPAIYEHIMEYEARLRSRVDQGRWWWELRACAYYTEFQKPKITYPNICKRPEFTFDDESYFTNQKCFIITKADKYLLAILNSTVIHFLFEIVIPKLRGGFFEPGYVFMKDFPIPSAPESLRNQIASLARHCLEAAASAPEKIQVLETELNALVYQAYGLDEDDIRVIEGYLAGHDGVVTSAPDDNE